VASGEKGKRKDGTKYVKVCWERQIAPEGMFGSLKVERFGERDNAEALSAPRFAEEHRGGGWGTHPRATMQKFEKKRVAGGASWK
jgi:hypothetical protein